MTDRSKGEQSFIHEYTRNLLIGWSNEQVQSGKLDSLEKNPIGLMVYKNHAIAKGWLSKDGSKVTSKGFASAASRCKA